MTPIRPLRWPVEAERQASESRLLIATVDTSPAEKRDIARQQVRAALYDLLGRRLGIPVEALILVAQPGQPIRLAAPYAQIGLSVSHEPGLSLLAIHLDGPVGIDLLVPPVLSTEEIQRLAGDYLGPASAEQLAARPAAEQASAFAAAWAAHEAGLKCLGLPLSEWQSEIGQRLTHCRLTPLRLPAPYIGMLARGPARLKGGGNPGV